MDETRLSLRGATGQRFRIAVRSVVPGLALTMVACCGEPEPPKLLATHEPMHPVAQPVTLRARATGDVDRVTLEIERYQLPVGVGSLSLGNPVDPFQVVKTCDPPGTVPEIDCQHSVAAFPDASVVRLRATAVGKGGATASESYFFAAGQYPLSKKPVPIRYKGSPKEKLDVVLIAEEGVLLADFRSLLDEVVEDLFFDYEEILEWRGLYNFYYSPVKTGFVESPAGQCKLDPPTNATELADLDGRFVLHHGDLLDCQKGGYASAEIHASKSLLHEAGHLLFGLEDEYPGKGSYLQRCWRPNVWSGLKNCKDEAQEIGYPESDCVEIDASGAWRIDPVGAQGCMMGASLDLSGSRFGKACLRRIFWIYDLCVAGDCSAPPCP